MVRDRGRREYEKDSRRCEVVGSSWVGEAVRDEVGK